MDDEELAELLTAELSSNAVDHAGTAFTVAVSHDDEGMLTVEVHDHDPAPPVMAPLDPTARSVPATVARCSQTTAQGHVVAQSRGP